MTHLDEGTIVALRDGALVSGDASEHLHGCGRCRTALEESELQAGRVAAALERLDEPFDVEAAKRRVRDRLDAAPERTLRRRGGLHLGRAAAILLIAAGAVSALPGSPVRTWLLPASTDADPVPATTSPTQESLSEGGIVVNVPDGRMEIVLSGVEPGSEVEVLWMDAATARVSAAAGSSFSFAEGRAEARVAPGPVRVELPRYAPTVSVQVDGRTYLRRSSEGGLEVLEPTEERSEDRIRFVVRERE